MASEIVTEEQVRMAAYYIWLAEGQPTGQDEAHWHRARFELESSTSATGGPARKAVRSGSEPAEPAVKRGRKATAAKAEVKSGTRKKA
jgi:hypothetical protein